MLKIVVNRLTFDILLMLVINHLSMAWNSYDFNVKTCPEERSTTLNGTFIWKVNEKNSINYVISQPDVCWFNGSIVLRRCNFETGQWIPPKVECTQFGKRNIECPDDLTELNVKGEYICLKISKDEQPFEEHFCYGSDYLIGYDQDTIDAAVITFLFNEYNITRFWMPIKRYKEKKFNPLVIRLPGKEWNEMYIYREGVLSDNDQMLSDKHCAAAYILHDIGKQSQATMQIKMTHCYEHRYSVCVFRKHFVSKSGCPQDFGALSHRPNECYGITWGGQKFPDDYRMLRITEYFKKLNTLKLIFDKFDIVNDKYVEIEGTSKVLNAKWAIKPESNQMKIVSSDENINGLCVEHIQSRKNVEIILRFDSNLKSLILTVYNKYYIWSNKKPENSIHCFTNADYEILSKIKIKKIWENDSCTKTIFKLKLESYYAGEYWCEAHTIFNFSFVTSKRVVAAKAKKGHVFSMQIEYNLTKQPYDFTRIKHTALQIEDTLKNLGKRQRRLNDLNIHNVRIMDILYIPSNLTYLKCICHTTVSLKSSTFDTNNGQTTEEENSLEDDQMGANHNTEVRMIAKNLLIQLIFEFQPQFVAFVRSIEFCFPESDWLLARMAQSATKSKFCLKPNGLPVSRKCLGDFINGAYWEEVMPLNNKCVTNTKGSLITQNLYTLDTNKLSKLHPEKAVKDVRKLLESNVKNLIPADLYYLAKIIHNTVKTILRQVSKTKTIIPSTLSIYDKNFTLQYAHTNLSETEVEIVRIVNYLLEVNDHVIRSSIALNSTNILLDAFEYLIDYISTTDAFRLDNTWLETDLSDKNVSSVNLTEANDKEIEIIEYADIGVVVKIAINFIVFAINPLIANVTGIAVFRTDTEFSTEFYEDGLLKGAFKNEYYRFILANQSVNELLNEKNILLGTFVPTLLWQRLDEISRMSNKTAQSQAPEPKIVIKIYANDKLFQESESNIAPKKIVGGKIISISIPGHDKDLPDMLPLILTVSELNVSENKLNYKNEHQQCSYWNYQTWVNDGVKLLNRSANNNNTVLCGCSHLTPFAFLVGGNYNLSVDSEIEVIVKKIHEKALDIITLLGCSLSLFGIAGIFVTAFTFRTWRQKANSKVLLQLSTAIALQMILFCFVNTEENAHHLLINGIFTSCIALGACLHYSILVQFCWMVIIAYLQFKRYVQVFGNTRPKRFFIKSTILGWGLPLIPVVSLLLFDSASYIPHHNELDNPICYPFGLSLYISIVFPITLVILANLVIYFVVIYNILKNPAGTIRHTEKSLALSQIRLLVLLFFLLGFTWIFGLLTTMKAGLVFSYLFCLTATLQGFILFIYFIVMDPVTRRLWHSYLQKICGLQRNLDNFSNTKETT